jgi:nitroimidazol reductase NimA-like FMN-containing flavoprotein (pyridoxamine 5'-phosphate oxidase superfamily)
MDNAHAKAREIIDNNLYLVLGTSSQDNVPWVTPLFFAVDDELRFFFLTGRDTRHSVNIQNNPGVSLVIYDSQATPEAADGVYVEGTASIIGLLHLPHAIACLYRKRFPTEEDRRKHFHVPEDFWAGRPRRFYQVVPSSLSTLDKTNGDEVDRRIDLDLDVLRLGYKGSV